MITCFVCWSGNPDKPWRDASLFVRQIERLGNCAYLTLDRETFPMLHEGALAKCCLFRWRCDGQWIMAQVAHKHENGRDGRIYLTARVVGEG